MASSSTSLHAVDDVDDDEFDWEAAVKEIDVACAQTTTATNYATAKNNFNPNSSSKIQETYNRVSSKKPVFSAPSSSRQSTLDNFIGVTSNSNAQKKESGKKKLGYFGNGFSRNGNNSKCEEEEDDEETVSFIKIDPEAAKTWIYPVNAPLRDYQFHITSTALFSNTLAALPTGLGKTLVAAVVMYNYFRWFPEGKIVFAAPSRPLVMQQIEACHKTVGIPQEWTIDLTGQTSPSRRACHWKTKRVFFVTPQVLEKDIQTGSCLVKHLVCLVIDEAHRATGNYSYCVAVRELMAVPVPLRILALTATPGSKKETVQHIINNLQISTLEYRDENDSDVKPYVHDRKIELIEVPMGKDALEINNLILEVIRPYAARLSAIGVLPNRDFQTLSPCDLLNSRDKFRQEPPQHLPHMKYGEVEGNFGVLLTLYHIRKLLSSHGIKPAFEMLEEKLRQGSFARLMSRNEGLLKAKLLMEHNISHGAPSPKLSKMLEILIDHFKMKDPQNSRVIIFSNFRGSVRDIMDALKNMGEFVKATEFIGQSSGKSLKGQSQKVQQAVLEKFRAGGYNVIVATSIGEEGLDIMEVDLVICFDANISSLRMVQRMGRTGRKHEGRVVVLACEGSELKGYMRKQASSKAIKKHMQNGGKTSFQFHSSPRMIPHIFKPEVQFVELAIEQFVPRVKKVYEDHPTETPLCKTKLTDAEINLIAKYFNSTRENTWRPSLVAFPHFQAFSSRVHKVVHSFRTTMLIDAMQLLRGLSFSRDSETVTSVGGASPELHSKTEPDEHYDRSIKGESLSEASLSEFKIFKRSPEEFDTINVLETEVRPVEDATSKQNRSIQSSQGQSLIRSFLFGSGFVSVDDIGKIMISSLPEFPLKHVSHSKCASPGRRASPYPLEQASLHFAASVEGHEEMHLQAEHVFAAQLGHNGDEVSELSNSFAQPEKTLFADENSLHTSVFKQRSNAGNGFCESPKDVQYRKHVLIATESDDDLTDVEMSARLTNFIESGVVPESPVDGAGVLEVKEDKFMAQDLLSAAGVHPELVLKSSKHNEGDIHVCEINVPSSAINKIPTPGMNAINIDAAYKSSSPTVEKTQTPSVKLQDTSFSEDCYLNSENKSESAEQQRKFRRLRKLGDLHRKRLPDSKKQKCARNFTCVGASHVGIHHGKDAKQHLNHAKVFIEEEAEVSSEVTIADDDKDEEENDSYDDSFIDDRINPTAASTQPAEDRIDMLAIYRRSLLSQSPIVRTPNISAETTANSDVPRDESTSTGGETSHILQTPQNGSESTARTSASFHSNSNRVCSDAMPSKTIILPHEHESKMENRKRKLSFYQAGYLPVNNLEIEFLLHSQATRKDSILQAYEERLQESRKIFNDEKTCENSDMFDDDQFYDAIDLDAMEEQAAKLLKFKSEFSSQKQGTISEPVPQNLVVCSPSFDLGI